MTRDVFRPRRDPARLIYDTFQAEAQNRGGRTGEEWHQAELAAVWRAARDWAQQHGLRVPLLSEVQDAERMAMGHVDYGAKWAYGVTRLLEQSATEVAP